MPNQETRRLKRTRKSPVLIKREKVTLGRSKACLSEGSGATAAPAALASTTTQTQHLSAGGKREGKSLVTLLVEAQIKELEIKLWHCEELETMMERGRGLRTIETLVAYWTPELHMEQLISLNGEPDSKWNRNSMGRALTRHTSTWYSASSAAPSLPSDEPPGTPPDTPLQPGHAPGPGSMMPGQPMRGQMTPTIAAIPHLLGVALPLLACF